MRKEDLMEVIKGVTEANAIMDCLIGDAKAQLEIDIAEMKNGYLARIDEMFPREIRKFAKGYSYRMEGKYRLYFVNTDLIRIEFEELNKPLYRPRMELSRGKLKFADLYFSTSEYNLKETREKVSYLNNLLDTIAEDLPNIYNGIADYRTSLLHKRGEHLTSSETKPKVKQYVVKIEIEEVI